MFLLFKILKFFQINILFLKTAYNPSLFSGLNLLNKGKYIFFVNGTVGFVDTIVSPKFYAGSITNS